MSNEYYTDKVKECIFCWEQSTPEKYDEDIDKASDHESRIFKLFKEMTDPELDCYRAKLVELGYVDYSEYNRTDNGLVKAIK